jgi:MFS family permease
MNTAWVIGPLIAGYIASKFNIRFVFMLASIFVFIAFLVFLVSRIKDTNIKKKVDNNITKNFIDFFKDRDRVVAYMLRGGISLWWILPYLFMPLFMIRNGLNALWVGYFLFAIPIPLILFEYKFGKLASKIGFKKIFNMGYLIPCIITLICFFVTDIYVILSLLVLASVGLAMLEPTTEAYFFNILKGKQDLRFYGPYNTTININHLIAKILPATLLIFLPFKFIFLLFSLFMFLFFLLSFKVKNIIEKR